MSRSQTKAIGLNPSWSVDRMDVKIHNHEQRKLCMVRVSRNTAIELIESLSHQLRTGNPNEGRLETNCEGDVNYLSIAVMPEGSN